MWDLIVIFLLSKFYVEVSQKWIYLGNHLSMLKFLKNGYILATICQKAFIFGSWVP